MSDQGVTYAKFLEAELKAEYDRRGSLASRAKDLTTTSGAFVALVLALVALIAGKDFKVTAGGGWVAVGALGAFIAASLLALLGSTNREYTVTDDPNLGAMLEARWKDPEVDARNQVATLQARTIASLRTANDTNASLVLWSLRVQVLS